MNFSDHDKLIQSRADAQGIDHDRREVMREVNDFISKKDGQWEQSVWDRFGTYQRPRYTFDRCRPILAQIWGEIAQNDFDIKVKPMGGGASKDTAKTYDGLIRNIEAMSNAVNVYGQAGKKAIATGFGCWRIEQDWADSDSFDQDLFIRPIHNAVDRVYWLGYYETQTGEDADGVTVDHLVSEDEYKARFGKDRGPQSLNSDRTSESYYYKREGIVIGELLYKQPVTKTLYQLPNGDVVEEETVLELGLNPDDLNSRDRETFKVMVRWYDKGGWLTEPEETVFDHLPVIPVWPNFEITDNKPTTSGALEWLMDEQRVHNYAISKAVEETALAPKPKIWLTDGQAAGRERKLATMNNNNDPAFIYTQVEGSVPPFQIGHSGINPGLQQVLTYTAEGIQASAGLFDDNMAHSPNDRSGIAIKAVQHKGDISTLEYFKALEVAITHTAKVLVHAIPKVYDTEREVRLMNEDGTFEMASIYETVLGEDGQSVTYNDLSQGIYDVSCDIGPAFKNRLEETAERIVSLGQIDPTMIMQNKDILLNSLGSPGMDLAAERARAELMKAGQIPETQWTDEEREQAQIAAQQPQPEDPMTIAAKAEAAKAEADQMREQVKLQVETVKLQQQQQKMDFEQEKQRLELQMKSMQDQFSQQSELAKTINTMADTLNKLREAQFGSEPTPTTEPGAAQAYDQQAERITQTSDHEVKQ